MSGGKKCVFQWMWNIRGRVVEWLPWQLGVEYFAYCTIRLYLYLLYQRAWYVDRSPLQRPPRYTYSNIYDINMPIYTFLNVPNAPIECKHTHSVTHTSVLTALYAESMNLKWQWSLGFGIVFLEFSLRTCGGYFSARRR